MVGAGVPLAVQREGSLKGIGLLLSLGGCVTEVVGGVMIYHGLEDPR